MATYSIAEAEGRLSELVDEASAGEIVTLTRRGKPVALLQPVAAPLQPVTAEMLDLMAGARDIWQGQGDDAATLVRNMRDEAR